MHKWLKYGNKKMVWMRYVSIPDDAQVYVDDNKYKCDKFILHERMKISQNDIKP